MAPKETFNAGELKGLEYTLFRIMAQFDSKFRDLDFNNKKDVKPLAKAIYERNTTAAQRNNIKDDYDPANNIRHDLALE